MPSSISVTYEFRFIVVVVSICAVYNLTMICIKLIGAPVRDSHKKGWRFPTELNGKRSDVWMSVSDDPGPINSTLTDKAVQILNRYGTVGFQAFPPDFINPLRDKVSEFVATRPNIATIRQPENRYLTMMKVNEFESELHTIITKLQPLVESMFSEDAVLLELTSISTMISSI